MWRRAIGGLGLVVMVGCVESTGACQLASELDACPECYSGDERCTFGDVGVTEPSCDGCQARAALYQALCDGGEQASRSAIEAGMVCETVSGVGDTDG